MGNLLLLIVGGNDTTRNSISGGLWFLNQFPEEYAKLRADPGLIPKMVPETHPLPIAGRAHAPHRRGRVSICPSGSAFTAASATGWRRRS